MIHSLRGRLLVGMVLLVFAGLVVADAATYVSLNSFLISRVDDQLNKREIGAKAPSKYVAQLERTNPGLKKALASHLIDLETFGIRSDDYATFFDKRCQKLSRALAGKVHRSVP